MTGKIKHTIKKIIYKIPSSAILVFHHITATPFQCKSGCLISFENFKSFIEKYDNYGELISVIKKPSKKKIAITFDDGLQDVYDIAYPYLKKREIPFTVLIVTDFLDTEGYITTSQLKEMANDDLVTIGSHGVSHKTLTELSLEQQKEEIDNSKMILENILGIKINIFSFSHGVYDKKTLKLLKNYSYGLSASAKPLNLVTGLKKKKLPRYNVESDTYKTVEKELLKLFNK